jgi:Holliday junction DNA helicase RuvA
MIGLLSGTVISKSPTELCVLVQGVGYIVSVPLSTSEHIGQIGAPVTLHTYLHVREDALQLYGFHGTEEREMFKLLISVSGIGPRMALAVLSGAPVDSLKRHVTSGDVTALTSVPGIGKKLAERLIMELKEKVGRIPGTDKQGKRIESPEMGIRSEAILALTSLGYSRSTAEKAVDQALSGMESASTTLEAIIKAALRSTARHSRND